MSYFSDNVVMHIRQKARPKSLECEAQRTENMCRNIGERQQAPGEH